MGRLVKDHPSDGTTMTRGCGARHRDNIRKRPVREPKRNPVTSRTISLVRASNLDVFRKNLGQRLVKHPPAADIVDRLILALTEKQRRRAGNRDRLSNVYSQDDPGDTDLASLQSHPTVL